MIIKCTKQRLIYTHYNGIEINKVSRGNQRSQILLSRLKLTVAEQITGRSINIIPRAVSLPVSRRPR
jgi:hypothetical protein